MPDDVTQIDFHLFVKTLLYTQPRILAMFAMIPIFNQQLMPGMLRLSIGAVLGLILVPMLMPLVKVQELQTMQVLAIIAKEAFIGFVLGFMIAIPFWTFEAVGFIIDNQRGASISATLNPLTGNDSSPLGDLMNQAFIVFFFVSGGFLIMLSLLYGSFVQWNIFSWTPAFPADAMPVWLAQLDRLVRMALLLGAPAIVAMFLAEVGLALVSRFVQQLQVFFLAMPIKCALALLVLVIYCRTLFDYAGEQVYALNPLLEFLDRQFTLR